MRANVKPLVGMKNQVTYLGRSAASRVESLPRGPCIKEAFKRAINTPKRRKYGEKTWKVKVRRSGERVISASAYKKKTTTLTISSPLEGVCYEKTGRTRPFQLTKPRRRELFKKFRRCSTTGMRVGKSQGVCHSLSRQYRRTRTIP